MLKSPYMEELRIMERLDEVRAILLRQGRKKFGRTPTKKQQADLNAITELVRLETLTDRLLDVSSWGELLATP